MWLKDKWHKVCDGSKYFLLRLISIDLESRNIFKEKTFLNIWNRSNSFQDEVQLRVIVLTVCTRGSEGVEDELSGQIITCHFQAMVVLACGMGNWSV